ncbi:MAG: metallophosphoesterase [Oligoflexia bacterium]|nr:metallophosphoesterase [Oligoflexia bacterium]
MPPKRASKLTLAAIAICALLAPISDWAGDSDRIRATVPFDGVPYQYATADRVVMCGDLHGNLDALYTILRHANLIDSEGHWSGGKALFVSPGDILDGNKESVLILNYMIELQKEAREAGGDVITTAGNHEVMVTEGDVLHVTKEEAKFYQDAVPEEHEVNSIHAFLGPDTERGRYMRSLNMISKITQSWQEPDASGNLVPRSRTVIAVHAGLDKTALQVPFEEYNSTLRAWMRYWEYKERTLQLINAQLKDKDFDPRLRKELKKALKKLEEGQLPLADEHGAIVERPPNNTAWVVGYDGKERAFDRAAVRSPVWARFNRIILDKKTGKPLDKLNPGAMTREEFNRLLEREGANLMVVGHEPVPDDRKLKVPRQIRYHPQAPADTLINMDTRIGWEADRSVGGTISYLTMDKGIVTFHNDIPRPKDATRASVRMATGAVTGCMVKGIKRYLNGK